MTGPPPTVDNRLAAQIVAKLAELASDSVPQWRPMPGGDAGTMLQQGFARLLELVLGQLNQVPDKNLLAFLDTMGVSLLPPAPARLPLSFALVPGSPPATVPAGATAAARPDDGGPAATFQTEADLTVVPGSVVTARVVDPVGDRVRDLTGVLAGVPAAFSPFTGVIGIRHALWFGTTLFPGPGQSADVTLTVGYASDRPASEVGAFLGAMRFGYFSDDAPVVAAPSQVSQPSAGTAALTLRVAHVDQQVIMAPGLPAPVAGQWLHTALSGPLPFDPVAQNLTITATAISVSSGALLPDAVIAGQAAADPSRDFQPFGASPQVGDACCIGSDEVFGKQGAQVRISFTAGQGTAKDVILTWEYLGAGGWMPLTVTDPQDGFDMTADGTLTIAELPAIPPAAIEGKASRWIRVRIDGGGYGTPVQWTVSGTELTPVQGTGDLDPPRLKSVKLSYTASTSPAVLRQTDVVFSDESAAAASGQPFSAFVPVTAISPAQLADADPALYLGMDTVAPGYPMTFYVAPAPRAASGRVLLEPAVSGGQESGPGQVSWEYFDGQGWRPLPVLDQTEDLTVPGTIVVLTPADMAPLARFEPVQSYWIRARAPRGEPSDGRLLTGVYLNTVSALQSAAVTDELLGSGNGQAGQAFALAQPPVLAGQQVWVAEPERPPAAEQQAIEAAEGPLAITTRQDPVTGQPQVWVRWHEVANFVCSGPADRHYTMDHSTGVVTFGDGSRGLIPPVGTGNISASYSTGGGTAGNVPAGAVSQLLSPIPAVQSVVNLLPGDGGAAGEDVALVRDRGPQAVRGRDRGVAAGDFEWLARQAAGTRVGRAICLPNVNDQMRFEPGWVTLIVIPQDDQPQPSPGVGLIAQVDGYLRARACADLVLPAPAKINVAGPGYLRVAVAATIVPRDITQAVTVKQQVASALGRYLHPLTGGRDGAGWVSGRAVYVSEIASVIEGVPGVSYVRSLRLQPSSVQRRLTLAATLVSAGARAGSTVLSLDRRKAFVLVEPLQAAALATTLTVTGLREGDVITNLLDLTLDRDTAPGSASFTAVPAPWPAPGAGFLAGTAVIGPSGRQTRLAAAVAVPAGAVPAGAVPAGAVPVGAVPAGAVPAGAVPLTLAVTDPGFTAGLNAGQTVTLVGQFTFTVTSVAAREPAAESALLIDVTTEPVTGDIRYPAGTVFGTLDGRVRLPLAEPAVPDPVTASIGACTLSDLTHGEQVRLLTAGTGELALAAAVTATAPVEDIVYLDPDIFPYATEHQLDMTGP